MKFDWEPSSRGVEQTLFYFWSFTRNIKLGNVPRESYLLSTNLLKTVLNFLPIRESKQVDYAIIILERACRGFTFRLKKRNADEIER